MFTQTNYSDAYDREKLRILQSLSVQVQSMAVKLDQIVSQAEESIFKQKSSPQQTTTSTNTAATTTLCRPTLVSLNGSFEKTNSNIMNRIQENDIKLATNQQIIKMEDPMMVNNGRAKSSSNSNKQRSKSIANLNKSTENVTQQHQQQQQQDIIKQEHNSHQSNENKPKTQLQNASVINKRNKQQRIFNTFVRDSINQLLGPDFMKSHDVQDIDGQVMEMIRKEAVENYLPENIRPRRAWHLAKASLRTLKRTLNNRKI